MRTLKQRAHVETRHSYSLFYERKEQRGSGFAFDCDEKGNLIEKNHSSLDYVRANSSLFFAPEVQHYTNRYWEPTILRCDCGRADVVVHVTPGEYNYGECDECGADVQHERAAAHRPEHMDAG